MPKNTAFQWLTPAIALLAGILGMTAVWVSVAVVSGTSASWLALLAAVDMAILLRLTNAPPGIWRIAVSVITTAIAVVLSQWLIAATQFGFSLGLQPLASSLRLGPHLAWQLSVIGLSRTDWVLLVASLPLAAILVQSERR